MAYLYGDSSPFPLDENFIQTMRDATEICVKLLQADELIEIVRNKLEVQRTTVEEDLAGFKKVAGDMAGSLEPHVTGADSKSVKEVATRLIQTVRGVLENAQQTLSARLDAGRREAESRITAERGNALPALEWFLLRHELAGTEWDLSWSAWREDGPSDARARASGTTPFGLSMTFDLDLTTTSLWARPVKVSDVKQGVVIKLPKKGRFGGSKMREVELDRYYVTEFMGTSEASSLVLRRALKPGSDGFGIKYGEGPPEITPLNGTPALEERIALEGFEASQLLELHDNIHGQLQPLLRNRLHLIKADLGGTPVGDLDTPAPVARKIIVSIAPLVREIAKRSPVEGELTLKREVQDGQREELFISVRELAGLYTPLGSKRRAYFDPYGLEPPVAPGAGDTVREPAASVAVTGDDDFEQLNSGELIVVGSEEDVEVETTKGSPLPSALARQPTFSDDHDDLIDSEETPLLADLLNDSED